METVKANAGMLCNFEVMTLLQDMKEKRKQKGQGQLATITYETYKYLEGTACKGQTQENVSNCLKALKAYPLNKNERLMMLNTPPTTPLEIQLIVEGSEERLSEEQVEEILKVVADNFNLRKNEEVSEEADG